MVLLHHDLHRASPRSDEGFTITELLVVISIILVLLAMAIGTYVTTTAAANAAACQENQLVLERAFAVARPAAANGATITLEDLEPYVKNFDKVSACPEDDSPFLLDSDTGDITCPNHP